MRRGQWPAPLPAVAASKPQRATPPGAIAVPAPLLGIFYRAPKPGEPPFVEVGSKVSPETVIGIIEVMKLMNTVRAGVGGEVLRIDAVNGELVEFGETILLVKG
jgi:acetyl-CoA carboxylase biotin carboxyl carrier protein